VAGSLPEYLVLFDGQCGLCQKSVRFIVRRDRRKRFWFAALQSQAGKEVAEKMGLEPGQTETMVLLEEGRAYTMSTAALRVCRKLRWGWPLMYGFICVPRFIRDVAYRFIARRRFQWFGGGDGCDLTLGSQVAARLIDGGGPGT
jgi:predicted DCC family thiol-disulfide oxidoreductase YuxK